MEDIHNNFKIHPLSQYWKEELNKAIHDYLKELHQKENKEQHMKEEKPSQNDGE